MSRRRQNPRFYKITADRRAIGARVGQARSRRSIGSSPIGRRNSDVAALAMKRTGSEIDVANFGACCDGSPVPAIGFDEAPRTP